MGSLMSEHHPPRVVSPSVWLVYGWNWISHSWLPLHHVERKVSWDVVRKETMWTTKVVRSTVATKPNPSTRPERLERDHVGRLRMAKPTKDGWRWYQYRGWNVHYGSMDRRSVSLDVDEERDTLDEVAEAVVIGTEQEIDGNTTPATGTDADLGTPVVLVHGFGASGYHWRYCAPTLAEKHRVFAPCLLGFGLSDKPKEATYENGELWRDQLVHFLEDVVKEPAVLVGNSLGGRAVLHVAATRPDLVRGLVLVNSAGRFAEENNKASMAEPVEELTALTKVRDWVQGAVQRAVLSLTFLWTKRPARVKQVLEAVYSNRDRIDQSLVDSIIEPALHENAMDTFIKVVGQTRTQTTVNELLGRLKVPTLLLWGMKDPWIRPDKAEYIRTLYPQAEFYPLDAGHCPQDDSPEEFVDALMQWMQKL